MEKYAKECKKKGTFNPGQIHESLAIGIANMNAEYIYEYSKIVEEYKNNMENLSPREKTELKEIKSKIKSKFDFIKSIFVGIKNIKTKVMHVGKQKSRILI